MLKDIRNLFELEPMKEIKTVKKKRKENFSNDKLLRDMKNWYEATEDYYNPVRTGNSLSSNYMEHESHGDKDKMLSTQDIKLNQVE